MTADNARQEHIACAACGHPVGKSSASVLVTPAHGLLSKLLYVSYRICVRCAKRAKKSERGRSAVFAAVDETMEKDCGK